MQKLIELTLEKALNRNPEYKPVDFLPEFFEEELNTPYINNCDEILKRLTVAQIFSYIFESDEVAIAEIYAFDDKPFCLQEKYADKTDDKLTPLNKEVWINFFGELQKCVIEEQFSKYYKVPDDFNDVIIGKDNWYIAFTENEIGENLSVHIISPKSCGFQRLFKTHDAQYDGKPVEFVRWANNLRSWDDSEKAREVVVLVDGQEKTIDGREINFVIKI